MAKRKKEIDKIATPPHEWYVPEQIDPSVDSVIKTHEQRLIPWAWFVLGRHVASLRLWQRFAEGNGPVQYSKDHQGIPTAVYLVRRALWLLGPRIAESIRKSMAHSCARLDLQNDNLARLRDGLVCSPTKLFGTPDEAIRNLRISVRGLFAGSTYAKPWLEFGIQLGDFWTTEHDRERDLSECSKDLINICNLLPESEREIVPPLKQIGELTVVDSEEKKDLVNRIIRICRPGLNPPAIEPKSSALIKRLIEVGQIKPRSNVEFEQTASQLKPIEEGWNSYEFVAFHRGLWELADMVENHLLHRPTPPTEDAKPKWNTITGRLTFEGQLARDVAPQANTIIPILDAFEEDGWPERIDSPIPRLDRRDAGVSKGKNERLEGERLHETVRQLNKKLSIIRFGGDGTGQGILWEIAYDEYSLSNRDTV